MYKTTLPAVSLMSFNFDSKSSQTKDAHSAGKRVFLRSAGKEGRKRYSYG